MSKLWKLATAVVLSAFITLASGASSLAADPSQGTRLRPATTGSPFSQRPRPTAGPTNAVLRSPAITNRSEATPPARTNEVPAAEKRTQTPAAIPALQLWTNDCVVFIGGTSTVGEARYGFLEALLTRRYPGHRLRFRNLAWEADTVFEQERPLNFPSLMQSLRAQRAAVIFANFGLMESLRGPEALLEFTRSYSALLNQLTNVTSRIVLLSPFRHEKAKGTTRETAERNKTLEAYVRAIRELATQHGLVFVDLFNLQNPGSATDGSIPLTIDGMHPSAYGYWRAAYEIERSLGWPRPDWTIEINAGNRSYQANGATLTDFQASTSTVQFRSLDDLLPGPDFRSSDDSISLGGPRTLRIAGLLPGRYVLTIDGVPLYEQSQLFWERGRVLTHGPEIKQADALREIIVQKNRDFFNYWRPQNWAFLNGDLISQPSSHQHDHFEVRWFPGEMQNFVPLLTKEETQISELAKPKFHFYELRRVE